MVKKSHLDAADEIILLVEQWKRRGALGAQAENHLFSVRNGILRDEELLLKLANALRTRAEG